MPHRHDESHRWQFEMLMVLAEEGQEEAEELFHKLLRQSGAVLDPLIDFIIEQPNHPRVAILLKLAAKMGSLKAAPILIRFLEIDIHELRIQAISGLGWLRARAALDRLDHIEGADANDEIRREAQIAIEEILREFPNLRGRLKNHERIAIAREAIKKDSQDEIARATPPGGAERRRLVGMFPRLLALKYKAVPLGMGPGGVLTLAVPDDLEEDPREAFRELLDREVELHAWPRERVNERILTFYKWGDEDWIQFGELNMTANVRREITRIVLADIVPTEPHSPLPDAFDSGEAVQTFLSICAREAIASALIEYDGAAGRMDITLTGGGGERQTLDPPAPNMRTRFFRALSILADCKSGEGDDDSTSEGCIRTEHPGLPGPLIAVVRTQNVGGFQVMVLEVVKEERTERN